MSLVIDFEHHYVPEEIVKDATGEVAGILSGKGGASGNLQFWRGLPANPLKRTILEKRAYDLDEHIAHMDEAGIDVTVLTSTAGWHANLEACKFLNEKMAEAVGKYPKRLVALAHVPPLDGEAAFTEVRRAVEELGHRGVAIPCFIEGRNLDSRDLWPFYEAMNSMKLPIFVHPSLVPPSYEPVPVAEYDLHRALIREFDIVTSLAKLALGGVPSAFPACKFVFCHLGSGISVFKERIQRWEITLGLPTKFEDEFRRLYFTMGGYEVSSIHLQSSLMGIGPDRLMFGTDYPYDFRGGGPHLRAWVQQIRNLPLPMAAKDNILGDNAARLLGIEI